MGSVCCTASRAQDMAEASDGWSMEQSRHVNTRETHGALSPPLISSQWDRRPHFSELAASYNGMLVHRTASSSSRSCSNSISSESRTTASHRRCETTDGLRAVFNSPSDSFRYLQRPLDHIADSIIIPSESVWKQSVAHPNQEESGLSASSVAFSKSIKESDTSKRAQNWTKFDFSGSKQNLESSLNFIADGYVNEVTSIGLSSSQQMLSNVDVPLSIPRQKSCSWRTRGFSELGESLRPRSLRWSNMGTPANLFTDGEQEEFNEFYIRSTAVAHNHDASTPQVESPKCGLCSNRISQKSFWAFSRALGSKELPVVGILECGHVYHAECLDQATPITQARDPPCPKCKDEKSARTKVQEDLVSKSRMREHSRVKGKISRVGVSLEDLDDAEPSKVVQYQCGLPESSFKKGVFHLHNAEKGFSTKALLRRQFSFRGKASREISSNGFGSKRPGYAARVSPENSTREDDSFFRKRVL